MLTSADRILTTHVGSLPRPADVVEVLFAQDRGEVHHVDAFESTIDRAVQDAVSRQVSCGVDSVSDGEMSKISYATYIRHRLSGFEAEQLPRAVPADLDAFPDFRARLAAAGGTPEYLRPVCRGDIALADPEPLARDLGRLRAAVERSGAREAFVNAPSPGVLAIFQPNEHYSSDTAYLGALAAAMAGEYRAIVDAGFILQVDCPDLALGRHSKYQRDDEATFLAGAQARIEILNDALRGIPPESVRAHVCWGNYEGPHHLDIPLKAIQSALAELRVGALLIEGANPRHAHEWEVWSPRLMRGDQVLVPGVIDSTTNYIEHPELVAQRIRGYVERVGRERVIAGTDCGFGTFAGFGGVDPKIAYAKLTTLAEGAALASRQLW